MPDRAGPARASGHIGETEALVALAELSEMGDSSPRVRLRLAFAAGPAITLPAGTTARFVTVEASDRAWFVRALHCRGEVGGLSSTRRQALRLLEIQLLCMS